MNNIVGLSESSVVIPTAVVLVSLLFRKLFKGSLASLGLMRFAYLGLLGAALIVSGLLIVNPEPLASNFPGWKGPAGILLLASSCIGASHALWKLLRATTLVVIWGGVSLVLASSIFLDKLPQDLKRDDIHKIQAIIPIDVVNRAINLAHSFSVQGMEVKKLLRIADYKEPQEQAVDA